MNIPNPPTVFSLADCERLCFLTNVVDHPQITIGDYTKYAPFITGNVADFLAAVTSENRL
ncbi:hypothetical protein BH09BAC4_BH09BAC4_08000 [soil metagenome]